MKIEDRTMQKIEKKDIEKFFVAPIAPKRSIDYSAIHAGYWDEGEKLEPKDFYWAQLYKAEALGFPIDGGTATVLVKTFGPGRAIAMLFWLMTALEVLVKKGLGLPRAILFIQILIAVDKKDYDSQREIDIWFPRLRFPRLLDFKTELFFGSIIPGMKWALDYILHHPQYYQEVFEKLGAPKTDDEKLTESCNGRNFLREGWQPRWVHDSTIELARRFNLAPVLAEDLLNLLCEKAKVALGKPCNHRRVKTEFQMMFSELGCPLNQYNVPRFIDMLNGVLIDLEEREIDRRITTSTLSQ